VTALNYWSALPPSCSLRWLWSFIRTYGVDGAQAYNGLYVANFGSATTTGRTLAFPCRDSALNSLSSIGASDCRNADANWNKRPCDQLCFFQVFLTGSHA
jgi:hypothetical protein